MTKANIAFALFVNSVMNSERITHAEAWMRSAALKPDLNTLMLALGATRQRVQFFNDRHQVECQTPTKSAASRFDAREAFHSKVHAYMAKFSVDYDAAYRVCQRQFPNEAAAMAIDGRTGFPPITKTSGKMGFAPLGNPGLLELFCLPADTRQEVFQAAYEANGTQFAAIHPAKVFDGLANYFMDKKSISHDAAIDYCKGQFPKLWAAVKELSKLG